MIQRSTLFCLGVAAAGGAALFLVTNQAQKREEELSRLRRQITASQEMIHVLRAEWSYLNQPDRLKELAVFHLGMEPVPASRIVRLEDLPVRQTQPPETPAVALGKEIARAKKPSKPLPSTPTLAAVRASAGSAR